MVGVMVRRQHPMRVLAVCSAAGLIVALALLEGTTQGIVATVSGVVLLVAVAAGLDNKDSRELERQIDAGDQSGGGPPTGVGGGF
jgi:peptidoglycan/LPS O-acetylase OafA/YrhL